MHTLRSTDLQVVVNEEFGGEIRRITYRDTAELLWLKESSFPVPARESMSYGSTLADWLSHYRGGWQGLMPNVGEDSEALGVSLPYHGDTSTSSWTVIEAEPARIVMEVASRLPLRMRRTIELDGTRPVLHVHEEIENLAGFPVPFLWGQHPAWNADAKTVVDLPAGDMTVRAVPGYDTPLNDIRPGSEAPWPWGLGKSGERVDVSVVGGRPVERLLCVHGVSEGWAALRWEERGIGAAIRWDIATFPYVWIWTEIGGQGFPWYGAWKVVAVEPMCTPHGDGLAAAQARGEAFELAAYGSRSTTLSVSVFPTAGKAVRGVSADGRVTLTE